MTEKIFESPGSSEMITYVWQIAVMLIGAFIFGYWLRALLNTKCKSRIEALEMENSLLKSKEKPEISEADVRALNRKIRDQKDEIDKLNSKLSDNLATRMKVENELSSLTTKFNALAASGLKKEEVTTSKESEETSEPAAQGSSKDDLKKIEGVGPKIESILNAENVLTYSDVINASVDRINSILAAAGPTYAVHDPSTWAEQATIANNGDWDGLKEYQSGLKGGKKR